MLVLTCFVLAAFVPASAKASEIISTSSVSGVKLGVNDKGEAMVTYTSGGKTVHVLVSGAENTSSSSGNGRFTLEYDGGYKKYYEDNPAVKKAIASLRALQAKMRKATAAKDNPVRWALKPQIAAAYALLSKLRSAATEYWKTFTCPAYSGPGLAWRGAACTAPDGSYWAIQEWKRGLPNYGASPTALQASMEVHLSHWTGPLATLTVETDWTYGSAFQHLFGTLAYDGAGVYGTGVAVRRVYIDTLGSPYGTGWMRESGVSTHGPDGSFCYGFYPHAGKPAGVGTEYRATVMGPGVTPDVMWEGPPPPPYDPTIEATAVAALRALNDPLCRPHL